VRRSPGALATALAAIERAQLRRVRHSVDPASRAVAAPTPGPAATPDAHVLVEGRRLVNFCSNDYLGLARHPEVAAAMHRAVDGCGVGSGASHLVSGHGIEHERLEAALAEYTGRERALLFSTGYMANLGAIATLAGRGDLVLGDQLNHASLIDGGRVSGAQLQRYAHGDAPAADTALAEFRLAVNDTAGALLATDGLFSMDGDLAPLPALAASARRHSAWLLVDDAHGLGVLGPSGRGSLEHFGLTPEDVPVLVGTLGKAFGACGAFVAGSGELIDYLVQKARTYIYTTALPQAVAAAALAALQLSEREAWRRTRVLELTRRFRRAAAAAAIPLVESLTPIQPILLRDPVRALAVSRALFERGFWVTAIRPPTVPAGSARLRVTFSAAHAEREVDALVTALAEALAVR
jgi:8-amino-7-oxononanoate synthase